MKCARETGIPRLYGLTSSFYIKTLTRASTESQSNWGEMSVSFARRFRCFRVKIEDLQTAELAYIRCQTWRVLFEMRNHQSPLLLGRILFPYGDSLESLKLQSVRSGGLSLSSLTFRVVLVWERSTGRAPWMNKKWTAEGINDSYSTELKLATCRLHTGGW